MSLVLPHFFDARAGEYKTNTLNGRPSEVGDEIKNYKLLHRLRKAVTASRTSEQLSMKMLVQRIVDEPNVGSSPYLGPSWVPRPLVGSAIGCSVRAWYPSRGRSIRKEREVPTMRR